MNSKLIIFDKIKNINWLLKTEYNMILLRNNDNNNFKNYKMQKNSSFFLITKFCILFFFNKNQFVVEEYVSLWMISKSLRILSPSGAVKALQPFSHK